MTASDRKARHIGAVQGFVREINNYMEREQARVGKNDMATKIRLSEVFRRGQEATGVSDKTIRTIYYGFAVPSVTKAIRLSKWLNVTVNDLFSDQGED